MKIAVIGTGYVGITTSASLGELGHEITAVDVDQKKVELLNKGICPIYEPGVEPVIRQLLNQGMIHFTTRIQEAVDKCDILFITVGTPSKPDGEPDMSYVEKVARQIGTHLQTYRIIVNKSTVPVGTVNRVREIIQSNLIESGRSAPFDVVSNPEFLQEGKALNDARNPERIIIGCYSRRAGELMQKLYEKVDAPKFLTTPSNAEMIKYASNAFLATKISFVNELSRLCSALSVDITEVVAGMGMDQRIGKHFLQAGIGYGGSCFPKDVAALYAMGKKAGLEMSILKDVQKVNLTQVDWFVEQMVYRMKDIYGKRFAFFGLSFKPDTDDLREAPSLRLIAQLRKNGAMICSYDPVVSAEIEKCDAQIRFAKDPYQAAEDADAVILCTEWSQIVTADWSRIKQLMRGDFLFDGRNVLNRDEMHRLGFQYVGVGK